MRIVIGEDSVLFCEGLARLLEDAGHTVVGKASDAPNAVAAVHEHQPDLVVLDINMPPDRTDDGARAAHLLRHAYPRLGILLLSQHVESQYAPELLRTGGFGYLLKDRVFDVDDFLEALRRVATGGSALDPEVVTRLITSGRDGLHLLTRRERDVLALMAEGYTNVGIARRLWLSDRTVETHTANIMAKLGLTDSDEEHRRVVAVLTYLGHRLVQILQAHLDKYGPKTGDGRLFVGAHAGPVSDRTYLRVFHRARAAAFTAEEAAFPADGSPLRAASCRRVHLAAHHRRCRPRRPLGRPQRRSLAQGLCQVGFTPRCPEARFRERIGNGQP